MSQKKDKTLCSLPRCYNKVSVIYYKHPICEQHWEKHCKGTINLKKLFRIEETPIKQQTTPIQINQSEQAQTKLYT